ncbi:MAG: hypothetical protein V5A31_13915 [Haloferacaceae archaeon]
MTGTASATLSDRTGTEDFAARNAALAAETERTIGDLEADLLNDRTDGLDAEIARVERRRATQ